MASPKSAHAERALALARWTQLWELLLAEEPDEGEGRCATSTPSSVSILEDMAVRGGRNVQPA